MIAITFKIFNIEIHPSIDSGFALKNGSGYIYVTIKITFFSSLDHCLHLLAYTLISTKPYSNPIPNLNPNPNPSLTPKPSRPNFALMLCNHSHFEVIGYSYVTAEDLSNPTPAICAWLDETELNI